MSTFCEYEFQCECGATFKAKLWESVNVTKDPDLRQLVLDGQLNVVTCPECQIAERIEKVFLYHDMDRGILAFVYPEGKGEEWKSEDEDAIKQVTAFLESLRGEDGVSSEVKVVFGLEALRELVAAQGDVPTGAADRKPVAAHASAGCGCGCEDDAEEKPKKKAKKKPAPKKKPAKVKKGAKKKS
ncbi:MAG: CpXC domain-containing protein [Methanopyri archaeon]|jgi:hypothetical protein|nr:CpXC domain-containing protein [Methanopyri archaeon]